MQSYKDISGCSGVAAYEIADQSITVCFKSGESYRYSYVAPGADYVEKMKKLALAGRGLSTFISQNIHDNYEQKLGGGEHDA